MPVDNMLSHISMSLNMEKQMYPGISDNRLGLVFGGLRIESMDNIGGSIYLMDRLCLRR